MRRSILSRPNSSTPKSARPSTATSSSITSCPCTAAKSRTRRKRRLAMRGVPRLRPAMMHAASPFSVTSSRPADRLTMTVSPAGHRGRAGRRNRIGRAGARRPARFALSPDEREVGQVESDGARRRPTSIMTSRRRSSSPGTRSPRRRARDGGSRPRTRRRRLVGRSTDGQVTGAESTGPDVIRRPRPSRRRRCWRARSCPVRGAANKR